MLLMGLWMAAILVAQSSLDPHPLPVLSLSMQLMDPSMELTLDIQSTPVSPLQHTMAFLVAFQLPPPPLLPPMQLMV